jgi:uncharacterized integral membrane protein (TIGR00698 family)
VRPSLATQPSAAAAAPRTWTRVRSARLERVRAVVPGLVLAGAIGLSAHLAAKLAFPYALAVGFEVPLAMLAGLLLVNVVGVPDSALPGIKFAVRTVLGIGIVLLGLRLNLQSIALIGSQAFWLVLGAIAASCTFAIVVGSRLHVDRRVAVLIGIGCSVCGNSAIAAAAPVVKANDREMSFAVATITLFGTLAVFVLPVLGHAMGLDALSFGLWAGTSVPDTAQTIATSAAYDTVGRDVATVVKLVRVVLLAPLLILLALGWCRYGDAPVSAEAARRNVRKALPFFVVGFIALAAVRTLRVLDPQVVANVDVFTRVCFLVALAGLGLQTRLGQIRTLGPRPFLLGLGTSGLLIGGSLAAILAFGLGPARTAVAGTVDPRPLGAWTAVCKSGTSPAYAGAFVGLSQRLSGQMGTPIDCARGDARTGDTVQRTTRGTATFDRASGATTFSDGRRSWSFAAAPIAVARSGRSGRPAGAVRLTGHVLAMGIPGAGAFSPVGTFHPGGPMHDKRDFAASTRPGEILDASRLLVASSSNFGAPVGRSDWARGSVLSLATDASAPLEVPRTFASAGRQVSALGGAVQLYSAQTRTFLNRFPNGAAETGSMPAVANPLGISINNAFGRPWIANAPAAGVVNVGSESVLDPDGRPLSEAPSKRAGGVFAGDFTNRDEQRQRGDLSAGAVGNAFLGASPDASGRAVFAVATADGALEQVHVEDGVDGLAPAGTLAPLSRDRDGARVTTRVGMVFNWVPDRFLYVSDPGNDAVLQLRLDDDFRVFKVVETRRLASEELSTPIDIAPAIPEVANPAFSSNTTLAGGADLYVANRGSGTIVRLRQDGRVRAVARVEVPGLGEVGPGRLNGIAVSPDAKTIWVSLNASGSKDPLERGSIIELPAFGAPR